MFSKITPLTVVCALTLSACMQDQSPPSEKQVLNGSGAEMEKASSKGIASLVFRDKTSTVSVPQATAKKRLAAFAEQCVHQRSVTIEGTSYRSGFPVYTRTDWHFRANVQNEGGIDRLLILGDADTNQLMLGDKDGFNVIHTTQILENGSGTTLKTRHIMFWRRLHDAAVQWTAGETSVCPDLTKLFTSLGR